MVQKSLRHCIMMMIFPCILPVQLACQSGEKNENSSLMALTKKMDARIDFYGRVLDEHGSPVVDADVMLHISRFTPISTFEFTAVVNHPIKTDAQGYFIVNNAKGSHLYVAEISKKGYDGSKSLLKVQNSFYYDHEMHTPFVPDPKNPLVYRMRKKREGAFLFKSFDGFGFDYEAVDSGAQYGRDLIAHMNIKEKDFTNPSINGNPLHVDVKAKGILNPKTGVWTMVLTVDDPDGGIIVSDKLLYEAPATGYPRSYTLHPESFEKEFKASINATGSDKDGHDVNGVYLYVKSRNPPLYSRIRMKRFLFNKKEILLVGDGLVTNPYGDRDLEDATDIPRDVYNQLANEVRRAFELGQRPIKPDLQKWVR